MPACGSSERDAEAHDDPRRRCGGLFAPNLTAADEEGTVARLRALRHELIDPVIAANKGRLVKTTGDRRLIEFGSVVDAVRCAVEVQNLCVRVFCDAMNRIIPLFERYVCGLYGS